MIRTGKTQAGEPDEFMRRAANLFLLLTSLALVSFFSDIELKKNSYLNAAR